MLGEDQSEGSGGSGAGQDGEALVKPDAISRAPSGAACDFAVAVVLCIFPQRTLLRPLRQSNVTPKVTA